MKLCILLSIVLLCTSAQGQADKSDGLTKAIQELQYMRGNWSVTNEFLNPDGSVARSLKGTYRFEWVIEDRVLRGQSEIPESNRRSAILFYVNQQRKIIEMVSVGEDGHLWVMTGEAGSDARLTRPFQTAEGKTAQLRFTRYNVKPDSFESKMEYTEDGGKTWLPGNHQMFRRSQ